MEQDGDARGLARVLLRATNHFCPSTGVPDCWTPCLPWPKARAATRSAACPNIGSSCHGLMGGRRCRSSRSMPRLIESASWDLAPGRVGDHWSFARHAPPDVAARRRSSPYGPPCERGGDGRVRVQDQGLRALEELKKRSEGGRRILAGSPDRQTCGYSNSAVQLQQAHMLDFNYF